MEVLPRAGGEGEQEAVFAGSDGFQHPLHGDALVVAQLPRASLVLKGYCAEALGPVDPFDRLRDRLESGP
jgi:hypothetical protein